MSFAKKLLIVVGVAAVGLMVYALLRYQGGLQTSVLNATLGTVSRPATSCRQILIHRFDGVASSANDGQYFVNSGNSGAIPVYCNMGTAGGGWTLAINWTTAGISKSNIFNNAASVNREFTDINSLVLSNVRHTLPILEILFQDRSSPTRFYAATFTTPENPVAQQPLATMPSTLLGNFGGQHRIDGSHWWAFFNPNGLFQYASLGSIYGGPIWFRQGATNECTVSISQWTNGSTGETNHTGYSSCQTNTLTNSVANFASVATGDQDMALFVRETLASVPVPIAPPADTDTDGVVDSSDLCPSTNAGAQVSANGCPFGSEQNPALSCLHIKQTGGSFGDGLYYFKDPDGTGPLSPYTNHCEMDLEGGGWTLAINWPLSTGSTASTPAHLPAGWTKAEIFNREVNPDPYFGYGNLESLSPARHTIVMKDILLIDRSDSRYFAGSFNGEKVLIEQPTTDLLANEFEGSPGGHYWTTNQSFDANLQPYNYSSITKILKWSGADLPQGCAIVTSRVNDGADLEVGYSSCKERSSDPILRNWANVKTEERDMALFIREVTVAEPIPFVPISDTDGDGIADSFPDVCPGTATGAPVDTNGCSAAQRDTDGDGVKDDVDLCPGTLTGEEVLVDTAGCAPSQRDTDGDGVNDNLDACPTDAQKNAPGICGCGVAETIGCGIVGDCDDTVPSGDPGSCAAPEIPSVEIIEDAPPVDTDGDGVNDDVDQCNDTETGVEVDVIGCDLDVFGGCDDTIPAGEAGSCAAPEVPEVPVFEDTPPTLIGTMTCIPGRTLSASTSEIECHITSTQTSSFTVAEIYFPFNVVRVVRISSPSTSLVGALYPSNTMANTVLVTSLNTALNKPEFQPATFNNLTILLETDENLPNLRTNLTSSGQLPLYYLEENNTSVVYKIGLLNPQFQIDTSFVMEFFTRNAEKIGVFQFIQLGIACFEKSTAECIENMTAALPVAPTPTPLPPPTPQPLPSAPPTAISPPAIQLPLIFGFSRPDDVQNPGASVETLIIEQVGLGITEVPIYLGGNVNPDGGVLVLLGGDIPLLTNFMTMLTRIETTLGLPAKTLRIRPYIRASLTADDVAANPNGPGKVSLNDDTVRQNLIRLIQQISIGVQYGIDGDRIDEITLDFEDITASNYDPADLDLGDEGSVTQIAAFVQELKTGLNKKIGVYCSGFLDPDWFPAATSPFAVSPRNFISEADAELLFLAGVDVIELGAYTTFPLLSGAGGFADPATFGPIHTDYLSFLTYHYQALARIASANPGLGLSATNSLRVDIPVFSGTEVVTTTEALTALQNLITNNVTSSVKGAVFDFGSLDDQEKALIFGVE